MKIIIDDHVNQIIKDTAHYIQVEFGKTARKEFVNEFRRVIKLLDENPQLGSEEPFLIGAPVLYRSIVVNHLNKLIYWINGDIIEIVDFWDTRREPNDQAARLIDV